MLLQNWMCRTKDGQQTHENSKSLTLKQIHYTFCRNVEFCDLYSCLQSKYEFEQYLYRDDSLNTANPVPFTLQKLLDFQMSTNFCFNTFALPDASISTCADWLRSEA